MGKIIEHIGIIGTGNLGTQIATKADELNYEVLFVYNRSHDKAQELAGLVDAKALDSLEKIPPCDILFLTVPDHQIPIIIKEIIPQKEKLKDTIIVHCSGATSIDVLKNFNWYGVFYPLQTFTKNKTPDWSHIPIFIEGLNPEISKTLEIFAGSFSNNILVLSSEERLKIHCGAVLVSNFVHALAHAALEVSEQQDFKKIYFPLILESIQKLQYFTPQECLTGPAKRKDTETLQKHLSLISNPEIQDFYKIITQYIQKNMI
ncbi:MAG: hypothetical protein KatS3mg035_1751 [Bacteroidia bacterium]|nr:MAG: hypothetical protein KatS3mg035_1751 [Bacteroidia bacterium]